LGGQSRLRLKHSIQRFPRIGRRGEASSIRRMIARMVSDHKIDKDRIFISGLSSGGAMTSIMLASYPEIFAAGAIIAGLPYGVAFTFAVFRIKPVEASVGVV
jgi:poly(hydroxyalkanoate) depolymerase family esterase